MMILTQEQRNVVANKINQLWTESRKCSVCGNEKWNIQDKLFSSPQFGGVASEAERQHYPVVILTCNTCGHSLMFNAITLGFSFNVKKETEVDGIERQVP